MPKLSNMPSTTPIHFDPVIFFIRSKTHMTFCQFSDRSYCSLQKYHANYTEIGKIDPRGPENREFMVAL